MADQNGILLESGTNELEIVEFEVNGSKYGINVIKVKEIIQPAAVIPIPHAHQYIKGIIQLRGEVLPVIDMRQVLGSQPVEKNAQEKYIVSEFNQQKVVFHVDNVSMIHRVSWDQIEKPSDMYQSTDTKVIGVIKRNDEMLLLLDFESIILEINPESGINVGMVKKLGERERSVKKLVVAEDSPLLRQLLADTLKEAGYDHAEFFENGQDALQYLESLTAGGKLIEEHVQLVITDIEMPQMDGHHLTRRIKEHESLKKLPVVIFSSLITNDLKHKGNKVGADDQISKPEINQLINAIDRLIL
ncbi:chemotaxis protein [Jeotgalibacillus salarius]|uniref:Chemotaxis signal transduction protein CheV n=1 Tax=Jeotgalibacillus salarius TaxID=546023 RepID=A0A4Y8LCJ6_9BACL|nr:chemotaxis protein [Jeotgalibacillus salarius]TFE00324.1 chemotaxis signal transduction protein CheV [Jeotgalibacillus salarius]